MNLKQKTRVCIVDARGKVKFVDQMSVNTVETID